VMSSHNSSGPVALTIAGFDPSSGAGITADLSVFAAHGIFGTSAITALTVQSTVGVRRSQPVDPQLLSDTLACLLEDLPPAGIKIGMLGGAEQVRVVAAYLRQVRTHGLHMPVVLDTVLRSSSGADLLGAVGLLALKDELLPVVDCITPNTDELALITGQPCGTDAQIEEAARSLRERYSGLTVLATGGHRSKPDDLLFHGDTVSILAGEHIETRATHGTGCALSSALLCGLVDGQSYPDAARAAKRYVARAMQTAMPRGRGKGPMNLLWPIAGHTVP
jgi:hydroxymethylpyrimidine/phosphomethylpyrimidine kinase